MKVNGQKGEKKLQEGKAQRGRVRGSAQARARRAGALVHLSEGCGVSGGSQARSALHGTEATCRV